MAWYLAEDRDLGNGITPKKFDAARQKALRDEQCALEQRVSVLLGAEDGVIGDADFHNPLGFDRVRPKNSAEVRWKIEPQGFLNDSPLCDDATPIPAHRGRRLDEPTPTA